jgi:superfamily II DNA or RNA helicase
VTLLFVVVLTILLITANINNMIKQQKKMIVTEPTTENKEIELLAKHEFLKILRGHQLESLIKVQDLFRSGYKRVLFRAATGWGKTKFASCISRMSYERGKRILLIAPRINLIKQIQQELIEIGIDSQSIGVIQAPNSNTGFKLQPQRQIQISTVSSLLQNYKDWKQKQINSLLHFDMVVVDETHMYLSANAKKIWEYYSSSFFLGLTGTPCGGNFSSQYQVMECGEEESVLIAKGYLPEFEYYRPKPPVFDDLIVRGDDYTAEQQKELQHRFNTADLRGDLVRWWKEKVQDRFGNVPTIVFATGINHARDIAQEYQDNGINAVCVDSKQSDKELRESMRQFISGEATHLINVGMCFVGFDLAMYCKILKLPEISIGCVQLALTSKNLAKIKQMWGRARGFWFNGKLIAIYLDHGDVCGQVSNNDKLPLLPDSPIEWLMDGKPKAMALTTKVCPESDRGCGRADIPRLAKVCPHCQYKFPEKVASEGGGLVVDTDSNAELEIVDVKPMSRFAQLMVTFKNRELAFEKFMMFNPSWAECLDAAKECEYKPAEVFLQWVIGQRKIIDNPLWLPEFAEFIEMLQMVKVKGGAPLATYKSWVRFNQGRNYYFAPTAEQLWAIATVAEYKNGWVQREIEEFRKRGKVVA